MVSKASSASGEQLADHDHRDQTGSNGANLSFPDALGIPTKDNPNAARNQWLQGLINAGPYIASAFFGCWCSDPLNNFFGRRGCIFISAIFCALSPIGSAVAQSRFSKESTVTNRSNKE
jgi:MFS family permease